MKLWKKAAILFSVLLLAGEARPISGPRVVQATSSTKDKLDKTQKEKENLENELDKTQDNLDNLEGKRDTLKKELEYLNSQLSQVSANLEELERQIRDKEAEITETLEALDEAKEKEQRQYDSMVAVTRCLYEQEEDSYLTAIFSAGSFSDMLNTAERIEKLVAYNQRLLEEYKENKILIQSHEDRLRSEKADLEGLKAKAEEEKAKVSGMVSQASNAIVKYGDQISDAEQKALEYEAKIREKEKDLEYLKKKLAEEIAMSQAAANGKWRDISEVSFAEGDRRLLANLIYCEAGGEPYAGQVAVGSVVINRVLSSQFPDTVVGVIYQSRQFSPVGSGRLELALASDKATDSCYRAADEAMAGVTNVGNCVFFRTPIEGLSGINIGGHVFY